MIAKHDYVRVTSAKYWYKKLGGRRQGSSLSEKYKRLFANKQIVCIEYDELSEQNEREIFRVSNFIFILNFLLNSVLESTTRSSIKTCWFGFSYHFSII